MYLLRQGSTKWLTVSTDMASIRQKVAAKQGAQVRNVKFLELFIRDGCFSVSVHSVGISGHLIIISVHFQYAYKTWQIVQKCAQHWRQWAVMKQPERSFGTVSGQSISVVPREKLSQKVKPKGKS